MTCDESKSEEFGLLKMEEENLRNDWYDSVRATEEGKAGNREAEGRAATVGWATATWL
jgi:hypothetical protein